MAKLLDTEVNGDLVVSAPPNNNASTLRKNDLDTALFHNYKPDFGKDGFVLEIETDEDDETIELKIPYSSYISEIDWGDGTIEKIKTEYPYKDELPDKIEVTYDLISNGKYTLFSIGNSNGLITEITRIQGNDMGEDPSRNTAAYISYIIDGDTEYALTQKGSSEFIKIQNGDKFRFYYLNFEYDSSYTSINTSVYQRPYLVAIDKFFDIFKNGPDTLLNIVDVDRVITKNYKKKGNYIVRLKEIYDEESFENFRIFSKYSMEGYKYLETIDSYNFYLSKTIWEDDDNFVGISKDIDGLPVSVYYDISNKSFYYERNDTTQLQTTLNVNDIVFFNGIECKISCINTYNLDNFIELFLSKTEKEIGDISYKKLKDNTEPAQFIYCRDLDGTEKYIKNNTYTNTKLVISNLPSKTKSVILPDTITTISSAFAYKTNLENINLDNIEIIKKFAFSNCKLREVYLPKIKEIRRIRIRE